MIKKYLKLAYMVKLQKKKGDDFSSPPLSSAYLLLETCTDHSLIEFDVVHRLRRKLDVRHEAMPLVHHLLYLLPSGSTMEKILIVLRQIEGLGQAPREPMPPDEAIQARLALDIFERAVHHEDTTVFLSRLAHGLPNDADLLSNILCAYPTFVLFITREVPQLFESLDELHTEFLIVEGCSDEVRHKSFLKALRALLLDVVLVEYFFVVGIVRHFILLLLDNDI